MKLMFSCKVLTGALWLNGLSSAFAFQTGFLGRWSVKETPFVSGSRSRQRLPLQWASIASRNPATEDNNDGTTAIEDQGVGAWIPIGSISSLHGLGPQRITVMGLELVVWEDLTGTNTWAVQTDVCPHRLAPLSQGRVDPITNCIECPYHGWQYNNNGTLQTIPQLEKDKSIENFQRIASLTSFPVHVAGDVLFAFLPSSVHGEMFPQSVLPEHVYPSLREIMAANRTCFVRDLPYSFDFLLENFMDPAHLPFAHHSLQSLRSDGGEIPFETVVSNFTHLELLFKDQIRGKKRAGIVSYQRPTMFHYRVLNNETGAFKVTLNIHVVPIRAGWSRVLITVNLGNPRFAWLTHALSNRFLNSDTWLHDAEIATRTRSQNAESYVYASESDVGTRIFRRWWRKQGLSMSPPNTFGPAARADLHQLSRIEQVNPWEYHSKHCVKCRNALGNFKKIEKGGWAVAIGSAIMLRQWPIPALILSVVAMYTSLTFKKLATVIEGNPHPSGYDDRSAAHMPQDESSLLKQLTSMVPRKGRVVQKAT